MSFLRSPKMCKSQGERSGLYGGCRRVSQPNLWSLSLIKLTVGWSGVIMQKDGSVRQHSKLFWLYGASQQPQPPRNEPHLYALLRLPPFPILDDHTSHYAHLQSNKETTVWTCAFSLGMYSTLQMTISIRENSVASFCEEYVLWRVFTWLPRYICNLDFDRINWIHYLTSIGVLM